ncbi:sterol desaturase family protein [Flammeovirgaceae bacterium SG7u.111]|nr:sterol desaturase family protein [Flammeovirgaceae bacterium SG7u.132]WPO33777.1 sterol desaturase family protein [Flammeovirgaceae bacterium SG7u.111]
MEHSTVKPKNTGKKQLFKNPVLESLTRTHISVPLIIFYSAAAVALGYGLVEGLVTPLLAVIIFIIGFVLFTLVEYCIHRFIFHMEPDNKVKSSIQYNFHGVHHEYPKDKARLAMPPVISVVLATLLFFAFKLTLGNYVFAFYPGFLSGYATYLCFHYIVHAFRPPKNFLKVLWIHHGIHHYKESDRAYGVTSPMWDFLFRTMPRVGAKNYKAEKV